ncbi:MAG TPA: hypothetical protein VIK55_00280 [Paludibacter sp.]
MKRFFQLALLGILSISTNSFAQVSSSKWQALTIVIDGEGSDWTTLPRFFNTESNVKYEFRNDAQNLYIILKAADRATQMQLMRAGFSVKLKVKTSPPTKVGIIFSASKNAEMPPMMNNQEGRTEKLVDKSVTNREFIPKDTAMLEGFQFAKGKIVSECSDDKSICFARSKSIRDQGTYEIRIPLREIYGNDYALETVSATPIQLQVNINDLSQNEIKKMRGKMGGGGREGGMRGSGGRGMGGGMNGGMNGNRELGGNEMGGEMGGSEMGERQDMQESRMGSGYSLERKSFNIDFKLSTGK